MARKSYTVGEAYEAIKAGTLEDRIAVAKRFPAFSTATPEEIILAVRMNVRKLEKALREEMLPSDDVEEEAPAEVEEEEEPKPKAKKEKPPKAKKEKPPKAKKEKAKKAEEDDDDLDDLFDEDDEEE